MRTEDPVHITRGRIKTPFWSVTKHSDALTVLRNPLIFSSRITSALPADTSIEAQELDRDNGKDKMLVLTDPPLHTALRKSINASFLTFLFVDGAPGLPPRWAQTDLGLFASKVIQAFC
jgi:cytochrome P450